MAKIDLKKSSGFTLYSELGQITSPDLNFKRSKEFSIDDIRQQLLNQDLSYPQDVYKKFYSLDEDDVFATKNIKVNVYVIPPNLAGIEYVKTRAIRVERHNKVYEVWYGGGTVILQKNTEKGNDIIISKVKRDQKFIAPAGYSVALVNTRQSLMILAEVMPKEARTRAVLDEMSGMAYYVIRKNAKQEIVRNPFYKHIHDYRDVNWSKEVLKNGITLKTPIIKQILRKNEKFTWLFDQTPVEIS